METLGDFLVVGVLVGIFLFWTWVFRYELLEPLDDWREITRKDRAKRARRLAAMERQP